jgi:hypothetical protein
MPRNGGAAGLRRGVHLNVFAIFGLAHSGPHLVPRAHLESLLFKSRDCVSSSLLDLETQAVTLFTATLLRPTLNPMRQIVLRAVLLLGAWAIGLLVAAQVVPGVSLSVSGFVVAVVAFSAAQAVLSLLILKLPYEYASLLLGGSGLALTVFALILATAETQGFTIHGMASWVATTLVVWLVTTIGAVSLPELLGPQPTGST